MRRLLQISWEYMSVQHKDGPCNMKMDLVLLLKKHEKEGRPRTLNKEHKKVSLECVDVNPSITVDETIASKF